MFSVVLSALRARRVAMLEAEALVLAFGARASAVARSRASMASADSGRRAHHLRVARVAERRYQFYKSLDTSTKYEVEHRWRSRAGALIP